MADYHGFLSSANLNPDMLERSFYLTIYSGMVKLYFKVFIAFSIALLTVIIIGLMLAPFMAFLYDCFSEKIKKYLKCKYSEFFPEPEKNNSLAAQIMEKSLEIVKLLFLVLFVYMALLFILRIFENDGLLRGNKLVQGYYDGTYSNSSIITTKLNGKDKELGFLACGSKNCAAIDIKTKRIYYFEQNSGYSFLYKK